jgi:hypothetical protein
MNIAFSALNLIDLICELLMIQLVNKDSEFSIVHKARIGIHDESEISDTSDSEEDTQEKDIKVKV